MPEVRIPELPVAASVSDDDLVIVNQGGVTRRATVAQVQGSVLLDQTFLTTAAEPGLPASRRITLSGGLTFVDGGPGSTFNIATTGLLNSLSALGASGIIVNSGGTAIARTLVAPAAGIGIASADGTGGNPTFSLTNDLAALEGLGGTGIGVRSGADTWVQRSVVAATAGIGVAQGDGVAGNIMIGVIQDLLALESLAGTGFSVRTALETWDLRSLVQPAAGLTITNADGVAGNPTFALANDLLALEGLGATGFATRTAADTWAQRTHTGTGNEIDVANGAGVAGNPTYSLPAALTFTGKTITGGTFNGPTFTGAISITIADNAFTVQDNADPTKQFQFEASGITAGQTRTYTVPNETGVLSLVSDATALAIAMS